MTSKFGFKKVETSLFRAVITFFGILKRFALNTSETHRETDDGRTESPASAIARVVGMMMMTMTTIIIIIIIINSYNYLLIYLHN